MVSLAKHDQANDDPKLNSLTNANTMLEKMLSISILPKWLMLTIKNSLVIASSVCGSVRISYLLLYVSSPRVLYIS